MVRALVASGPGEDQRDKLIQWWNDGFDYDITTAEGQVNMFSLIARERDIAPSAVPDAAHVRLPHCVGAAGHDQRRLQ